jgi:23S rRNA (cytidine1920-2'-O)/16S rRNA (cytidine1409-2'-O)-methyltransferase
VDAGEPVVVLGPPPPFVSRGGEKLNAALDRFGVAVEGRTALDAGASTGGFTDCLLQRGAAHVIAVDVGHGQLDHGLRLDPRVTVRERTNVRGLDVAGIGGAPVPLVVADLSFISLRAVARALVGVTTPEGELVVLIKPQFEAGHAEASRAKGVIRDPQVWRRAIDDVRAAFAAGGAAMMELMVSPLLGTEGNVEFLAHLRRGTGTGAHAGRAPALDVDAVLTEAERLQAARTGAGAGG